MDLKRIAIYPLGLLIALGASSVLLILTGSNPISAFHAIFIGALGSAYGISETLVKATPLLLTALAFTLPHRAGFWNIGGEGQLFIGALFAWIVASSLGNLPSGISIPLILIVSFLSGIIYISLPLLLKVKAGINEVFLTVILNFIAILLINYLTVGPLKEPGNPNPQTANIAIVTWLPRLILGTRLHLGFLLPIFAAILVFIFLYRTSVGYKIQVVGTSLNAARYGGIEISKMVVIAGFLGAGLAGMSGGIEILGIHHFLTARFPQNLGYLGILVAVLGRFNPIWEIPAAIFFAALLVGAETMQRLAGVHYGMIFIIISLITFVIIGFEKAIERRK